jgi:pantoate--beta-alanine ligase
MQIVRDVPALRDATARARATGHRIGFVPTMGALHEGHLSLIDRAVSQCECVVISIFVNPLQFAPNEDLSRYPRTEAADLDLAAARGATIAFVPSVDVMYGVERAIAVVPERSAERWEGAIRPGHFSGVLTVVAKLFNLVQPDVAVFGQKDLQQVTLVRALIRDLDFPIDLDVGPIVREPDGVAMSSRNRFLQASARTDARLLSRALAEVASRFATGVTDTAALCQAGDAWLRTGTDVAVDYLSVVNPESLRPVEQAADGDFVIVAARVGTTRLLDNHRLGDPVPHVP